MGRPKADIDPIEVEKLAEMQCTMEEIASFVGCNVSTVSRRFANEIAKGREEGKRSLRRMQWAKAREGNVVMQIWLGKQYLNQREKSDIDLSTGVNIIWAKELEKI